jgi:hypothetical protein
MYRHRFDSSGGGFPGALVSLLKPGQAFVDNPSHVGDPAPPPELPNNQLANHIADLLVDTTLPIVNVFTLTRGSDPRTAISTIITASDNDEVQDIYIMVSATQTTMPTSTEIKVAGAKIPGNSTSHNVTGLSANTTYYGWAMAVDVSGNESIIVASTPAFLQTDPEINYYSFVVREKSSGLTGVIQQVSIHKLSWNLTPQLSESDLVRYRPLSAGPLSNAFDNLGTTLITYIGNSYNVGNELFYFASPESVSSFTIAYHRPAYRAGFEIYKNGVLVYIDASVTTSNENPSPFIVTYNV